MKTSTQNKIHRVLLFTQNFLRNYFYQSLLVLYCMYYLFWTTMDSTIWLAEWTYITSSAVGVLLGATLFNKDWQEFWKTAWKLFLENVETVAKSVFRHFGYLALMASLFLTANIVSNPAIWAVSYILLSLFFATTGTTVGRALRATADKAGWNQEKRWIVNVVLFYSATLIGLFAVSWSRELGLVLKSSSIATGG